MNREMARKILGENATEEQITNLLNNYHVEESAKVKELESKITDLAAQSSKYSDYDEIKAQLDEVKKANMSEQEKLEQMKKETETNLRNSRIIVNNAKAKEILAGYNLDDDIISLVVSDDADKTIASANKLKAKFDSQKELVEKETRENLIKVDLTPKVSNVSQNEGEITTFEAFGKLSASEQEKWLSEHPDEFSKLT